MPVPPPALFRATPSDLRDAYRGLQERYVGLPRGRHYYAAFVIARLLRRGDLRVWKSFDRPPPPGVDVNRALLEGVVQEIFTVPASAVLRPRPGGVLERLVSVTTTGRPPSRVVVEPLFARQSLDDRLSVAVPVAEANVPRLCRLDVSMNDPSWLWNDAGEGNDHTSTNLKEWNAIHFLGQQQGVRCAVEASDLSALSAEGAERVIRTARTECPHRSASEPRCNINNVGCASKGGGTGLVASGAPRVLVRHGNGQVCVPDAVRRCVDAARAAGQDGRHHTRALAVPGASAVCDRCPSPPPTAPRAGRRGRGRGCGRRRP